VYLFLFFTKDIPGGTIFPVSIIILGILSSLYHAGTIRELFQSKTTWILSKRVSLIFFFITNLGMVMYALPVFLYKLAIY
jgi:hypothetical protein